MHSAVLNQRNYSIFFLPFFFLSFLLILLCVLICCFGKILFGSVDQQPDEGL